jgi:hypothetical protein
MAAGSPGGRGDRLTIKRPRIGRCAVGLLVVSGRSCPCSSRSWQVTLPGYSLALSRRSTCSRSSRATSANLSVKPGRSACARTGDGLIALTWTGSRQIENVIEHQVAFVQRVARACQFSSGPELSAKFRKTVQATYHSRTEGARAMPRGRIVKTGEKPLYRWLGGIPQGACWQPRCGFLRSQVSVTGSGSPIAARGNRSSCMSSSLSAFRILPVTKALCRSSTCSGSEHGGPCLTRGRIDNGRVSETERDRGIADPS